MSSCSVDEEGNHQISLSKLFKDFMKILFWGQPLIRNQLGNNSFIDDSKLLSD
jgi:hypothetical protein